MKTTLIINTYNQVDKLKLILDSCLTQDLCNVSTNNDIEIIVADDGSGGDTADLIRQYQSVCQFKLEHVWHEDNGFRRTVILNKAVAKASGDYIIFLDGDCVLFPDFIARHIQLSESGFFVAGNRVLLSSEFSGKLLSGSYPVDKIYNWGFMGWIIAKITKKVNKLMAWKRLDNGVWRKSRQNNWNYPKGCNIGLWRDDFVKVNGFDELFTGWGHEDADLFIRLLHSGVKIKDGRFGVPVLHLWHKENDQSNEQENYKRMIARANDNSIIRADIGINQYLTTLHSG